MGAHLLHRLQGVPATEARQNAAVGLYSVGVDVLVGEGIAAVDPEALQQLLVDIDEQLERMLKIGREYVGPDQTLVCGVMRMCTRDAVRTGLVAKEAGAGAISAILAVFPKECVEMWECAQRGDHARDLEIQASLYKKWQVLGGNQFPIRLKYALQVMGRDCGYCRSPITYLPEDEKKAIREAFEN